MFELPAILVRTTRRLIDKWLCVSLGSGILQRAFEFNMIGLANHNLAALSGREYPRKWGFFLVLPSLHPSICWTRWMYAGKVLCAQSSLVIVYADLPTTKTLRSCYAVILETKRLLFVMHLVLILVAKPVGWSIKLKLRVILLAVADPWKPAGLTGEGS